SPRPRRCPPAATGAQGVGPAGDPRSGIDPKIPHRIYPGLRRPGDPPPGIPPPPGLPGDHRALHQPGGTPGCGRPQRRRDRRLLRLAHRPDLRPRTHLGGFLRPIEIPPESGYTAYMDAAEIYRALPDKTRESLRGLTVIHSLLDNRAGVAKDAEIDFPDEVEAMAEVVHPLVFRHPHNGRPVLFISPTFTRRIVGFSQEASDQLLGELKEFAADERFAYVHQWQPNDLVIWDNWQSIHKGYGHKKKYRRVMHRTTLKGDRRLMDYLM